MNDICIDKDIVTDEYDAPKGAGFYITAVILVLACAGLSLLSIPLLNHYQGGAENVFGVMEAAWSRAWWSKLLIIVGGLLLIFFGYAINYADDVLRCLPLGNSIKNRFDFRLFEAHPLLRFAPAALLAIFFAVTVVAELFGKPEGITEYSLSGEGYTGYQWFEQIITLLAIFSLLMIIADGVINAGIIGSLIHNPVMICSNVVAFAAAAFIMVLGVAIIGLAIALVIVAFIFRIAFIVLLRR